MSDVERVARAICQAIAEQDGDDIAPPPSWDMKLAWLDQGEVDFALVAQAALSAIDPVALVQAGIDAAAERLKVMCGPFAQLAHDPENGSEARLVALMTAEAAEREVRALSASDVLKEMK